MDPLAAIFILILTLASGFFSGSETALFSLSSPKIKTYRDSLDPKKRLIAELLSQPRELLVTVFMLNTLVNILLQNVCSDAFGEASGWGLKVGVPLLITLLFGEIIPKNIGLQHNEAFSLRVVKPIVFCHDLLKLIRRWTVAITAPLSRILFFYLKKEENITREELEHVLETSQEHGVLDPHEAKLVWGYLKLLDTSVKELMQPKEDILYYLLEEPLTKLTHLFVDQECTRMPVCEGSLEQIVGMIDAKDYFLVANQLKNGADLRPHLTKPLYIPETTPARFLFKQFEETGQVIALVVDEYGSIVGLLTRKDLAEVVTGEIIDVRDAKALYTQAGRNEIIASGKLELITLRQLIGIDLASSTGMVTIGGWLTEQLGEIPPVGTTYQTEELFFQVLAANPNRVRRLYIRKRSLP